MRVSLRPVTAQTVREACRLDAGEGGAHVTPPAVSIAESKYRPHWVPYGAYDADRLIGFALLGPNEPDAPEEQWILRLMVDGKEQGKGYGTALTRAAIAQLQSVPGVRRLRLSVVSTNTGARRLYERFGFRNTGRTDRNGDLVFERPANTRDESLGLEV